MDSVQEETLAVLATGVNVDKKNNRPLELQRRRHRLTEEDLRKETHPGEKVFPEGKVRKRAKVTLKEIAQLQRVIIGILPYVKIAHLNRDANSATNVSSGTLRLTHSPVKSLVVISLRMKPVDAWS